MPSEGIADDVQHQKGDEAKAFEEVLEAALITAERRRESELFATLNKPFTIWSLTTIVAGLIAFLYSNYSTCELARASDNEYLARLEEEISHRYYVISDIFRPFGIYSEESPPAIEDLRAAALRLIKTRDYYAAAEFKEKSLDELLTNLDIRYKKWNVDLHYEYKPNQFNLEGANSAQVLRYFLVYIDVAWGAAETIVSRKLNYQDEQTRDAWISLRGSPDAAGEVLGRLNVLAERTDYIPLAVCRRRTFWPF